VESERKWRHDRELERHGVSTGCAEDEVVFLEFTMTVKGQPGEVSSSERTEHMSASARGKEGAAMLWRA
jgi:hypothetical protein